MSAWRCVACGYLHFGEETLELCPKCGAKKFEQLSSEETEKIENSRETNDIHMSLSLLMEEAIQLAERGIEIDLDPGCNDVFKNTLKYAEMLQNMAKAEIRGHVNKSKWG